MRRGCVEVERRERASQLAHVEIAGGIAILRHEDLLRADHQLAEAMQLEHENEELVQVDAAAAVGVVPAHDGVDLHRVRAETELL